MSKDLMLSFILVLLLLTTVSNLMADESVSTADKADKEKNLLLFFEIGDKSVITREQSVLLYESLFFHLTKIPIPKSWMLIVFSFSRQYR